MQDKRRHDVKNSNYAYRYTKSVQHMIGGEISIEKQKTKHTAQQLQKLLCNHKKKPKTKCYQTKYDRTIIKPYAHFVESRF